MPTMAQFIAAQKKKNLIFKLVLLGDTFVGKSSSVERFDKDELKELDKEPTIGAAFLTQTVALDDYIVKFEIWDTAGREIYRSLAPMYYRGAAAALVVYDITSQDSFQGAKNWIEELQRQGNADIVIGIAGNKCDLETKREVHQNDAKTYAEENGCIFFETSAKTGENINAIFGAIGEGLVRVNSSIEKDSSIEKEPRKSIMAISEFRWGQIERKIKRTTWWGMRRKYANNINWTDYAAGWLGCSSPNDVSLFDRMMEQDIQADARNRERKPRGLFLRQITKGCASLWLFYMKMSWLFEQGTFFYAVITQIILVSSLEDRETLLLIGSWFFLISTVIGRSIEYRLVLTEEERKAESGYEEVLDPLVAMLVFFSIFVPLNASVLALLEDNETGDLVVAAVITAIVGIPFTGCLFFYTANLVHAKSADDEDEDGVTGYFYLCANVCCLCPGLLVVLGYIILIFVHNGAEFSIPFTFVVNIAYAFDFEINIKTVTGHFALSLFTRFVFRCMLSLKSRLVPALE